MKALFAAATGVLLAAACGGMPGAGPSATTTLAPTKGNAASGTVTFSAEGGNKVRVVASVSGLTPGLHGFHVHEKGDCSAPDAMSAGGHFNPAGKSHGDVHGAERHAGDLGNLGADKDGNAKLDVVVEGLTVAPDAPNSVVGRAVVVHANPDDLKSQPAGNSGPRIACGVVARRAPAPVPSSRGGYGY